MKCNKIDVVILNGSGILLQDDTVLAREGQPLYIGCYCRFVQYTHMHHTLVSCVYKSVLCIRGTINLEYFN